MRKKNCSNFFDILFWFLVYSLPIICIIFSAYNGGAINLSTILSNIGIDCTGNVVYQTFIDLFGVGGVFPMFASNVMFEFASYFVLANILHLIVDVLVFIPRLLHNLMSKGE